MMFGLFLTFPQLSLTFLDFLWLQSFCTNRQAILFVNSHPRKTSKELFIIIKCEANLLSVPYPSKLAEKVITTNTNGIPAKSWIEKYRETYEPSKRMMFVLKIQKVSMQLYAGISFEISLKRKTMLKDCTSAIVCAIQLQCDESNICYFYTAESWTAH